jgi:hypothetical protein
MSAMTLKRIFPLLVAALLTSCEETGCESNPRPKTELEKLPPITQTGENTFGCLVNGKAWVPESSTDARAAYQNGFLQLSANFLDTEIDSSISLTTNAILVNVIYNLTDLQNSSAEFNTDAANGICFYLPENTINGTLILNKFDLTSSIVAGTFTFTSSTSTCDTVKITDGRFDLSLIL